jgi:chaperonin GroEL
MQAIDQATQRFVRPQLPRVVLQPHVQEEFGQGVEALVGVIRPTLGPLPRMTALADVMGNKPPEVLDQGGVIARRIVGITPRGADVGAMYLRQMLWRLHEEVGDGTATAAVLFHEIYAGGRQAIAAGASPLGLRDELEACGKMLDAALRSQCLGIASRQELTQVALSYCHDVALATIIGEILDELGEFGYVTLRKGKGRDWRHEYVMGSFWEGGVHSRTALSGAAIRGQHAAIFLSDLSFDDPRDLVPLVETAVAAGYRTLVVMAESMTDRALGLLQHASKAPDRFQAFAVKLPAPRSDRATFLNDLTRCTGGELFLQAMGIRPEDLRQGIRPDRLGAAESVWANQQFFGIDGRLPATDGAVADHLHALNLAFLHETESPNRLKLQQRIGNLQGASATVYAGGIHESAMEAGKELALRTVAVTRAAMRDGVLPGGGIALWRMRPLLSAETARDDCHEARAARRILHDALAAPIRAILTNGGYSPAEKLAQLEGTGYAFGCDARTGAIVDMRASGIIDCAGVQLAALRHAVKSAALALTIDVVVHRRKPEFSSMP